MKLTHTRLAGYIATGVAFSALMLGASGTVASASSSPAAGTQHPQLTDPAGDAKDSLGVNHPPIDILSSDVSTSHGNLVFTIHVAKLGGFDPSTNRVYDQQLWWGTTDATAQTTAPGSAVFSDFGGDNSRFSATGTSTYNTKTSNVTMTFSLAAINAGGPDHFGIGTQTYIANTVTSALPLTGGQAVDAIQPTPVSYIVGQ